MTGLLKKLAGSAVKLGAQALDAATTGLDRMANRQEFEACVAATVLIAKADGTIEPKEKSAAIAAIAAHPDLKSFGATEVQALFSKYVELLGEDEVMGTETLLETVHKVTDKAAKTRILGIATKIANADGTFSDKEKAMVERIRGS